MSSASPPNLGGGSSPATIDPSRRDEIVAKQQLHVVNLMAHIGRNHYAIGMMNPAHTTHASAAPLAPTVHVRATAPH